MLIVAFRMPTSEGSKVITKVVEVLAAISELGWVVTVKSSGFAPLITTIWSPGNVKSAVPMFSIVKVLTTVPAITPWEPKSVWLASKGISSPSAIETLLPLILISGEAVPVPVP